MGLVVYLENPALVHVDKENKGLCTSPNIYCISARGAAL